MSIRLTTRLGDPVQAQDITLTPESQALIVVLPFCQIVWNRATAVLVDQGGTKRRTNVVDVTRIVQLALLSLAAAAMLAGRRGRSARRKRARNDR